MATDYASVLQITQSPEIHEETGTEIQQLREENSQLRERPRIRATKPILSTSD